MQFFRKWFTERELAIQLDDNLITDALSTWGFVELDGSPLKKIYAVNHDPSYNSLKARWRYNTDYSKTYFTYTTQPSTSLGGMQGLRYIRSTDWSYRALSMPNNEHANDYGTYKAWFFIPLKNRGFYLCSYGGNDRSAPPNLYPAGYYAYASNQGWNSTPGGIMLYNNISNKFNLIQFNRNSDGLKEKITSAWGMDSNDFVFQSMLYDTSDPAAQTPYSREVYDMRYDTRANLCTLIKYPYDNGFLSNLFIITTSPLGWISNNRATHTGLWGKFFSFGGRNFYCFLCNLAIELPNN